MVKINPPSSPISPVLKPGNRTTSIDAPAPTNKEKQDTAVSAPFIERRKKNSDRRSQGSSRGPFDMRGGRDRRKNSGRHPSIDEDV